MRIAGAKTVTIHVPPPPRDCCEGAPRSFFCRLQACAPPSTKLELTHPSLYRSVCDETGSVRRYVNVFGEHFQHS